MVNYCVYYCHGILRVGIIVFDMTLYYMSIMSYMYHFNIVGYTVSVIAFYAQVVSSLRIAMLLNWRYSVTQRLPGALRF